jgi:hypothetical protein
VPTIKDGGQEEQYYPFMNSAGGDAWSTSHCPWETDPRLFGLADIHEIENKINFPPFFLLELIPMELCRRNNLRVRSSCKLKYKNEINFEN